MVTRIFSLIFFSAALANAVDISEESGTPIYECVASSIEQDQNSQSISDFRITIFEQPFSIAGRPRLYARGSFMESSGEEGFVYMDIIGIPEFLGPNMFHAYFLGSHTDNTAQKPEQFLLVSNFSMSGSTRARLFLDNRNYAIGTAVKLRAYLDCTTPKASIYVH